ncbi:nickel ABC transporter substrate-binding protein [Sporohalobacter salinus]|uniref:nickel ABC transporter substrate-binding protein n=1 Tax=Sporohalobacter salinus TaxID=1494606 RepID=UPI0019617F6B|nr:nickel ABC transporter substrate-binding protein [Sporohalobacter salinus]MBM7624401.1 peptide/nickel transport system substrate-binding protein [Sporohalobacter salinus]
MFNQKRFRLILVLILVFSLSMTAGAWWLLGEDNKEESAAKRITIASSSDLGLDKLDAASYEGSMQSYPLVYDALVEYDKNGKIVPSLAKSWEISSDGKVYTFHLRKGVKFSDGTPFNAEAVKFSVKRWANKDEHSWLKVAKNLNKVEVVDKYTVKLHFSESYHRTLAELSYPRPLRIMSPAAVDPKGDPEGKFVKPVGTGPWMVKEYVEDQKGVFIKNQNYWGEEPKEDKLVIKVIPEPQTRVLALQGKEVDLSGGQMGSIPLGSMDVFEQEDNLEIKSTDSTTSYFLIFNNKRDIFKKTNIRRALNYAINKDNIAEKLFNGRGKPAKGLFQFTVPYVTEENNKGYEYNPEKAKNLLKNSGWTDSNNDGILDKNGRSFKISLLFQVEEFPEWKPICEIIQSDLSKVGIDVELKILEKAAYYDALWENKNYDLVMYRTYSDAWNPYGFLTSLFHASNGESAVAYGDERLDLLIDKIETAENDEKRQKIYDKIFNLMHDKAVCIPVYYPEKIFIKNLKIKGFEFGNTTYRPVIWKNLKVEE